MAIVRLPTGETVKVPDGMDEQQVQKVLANEFGFTQKIEEPKTFWEETWQDLKANWPQYGGATVGGVAGGLAGGFPGAVGGAFLGGMGGKGWQETIRHIRVGDKSPAQIREEVGKAGAQEGITELAGGLVMKPAKRLLDPVVSRLTPFAKTVTEQGRTALNVLNKYMPRRKIFGLDAGPKYAGATLAQVTDHRGLDFIENIAERSAFGSETIFRLKGRVQPEAFKAMTDDLATSFGEHLPPSEIGSVVVDVIQGRWGAYREAFTDPLYNAVLKRAKDASISLISVKKVVAPQLKRMKAVGGVGSEPMGDHIAKAISKLPDKVSFDVAWDLIKRLRGERTKFQIENKGAPAISLAKHLTKLAHESIERGLRAGGYSDSLQMWKQANEIYKMGTKTYNDRIVRGLIRAIDPEHGGQPEKVLKRVFQKGGATAITKIKDAVGNETFSKLKRWYIADIIDQSIVKGTDFPSGDTMLLKLFNPARGMGNDALASIFTRDEIGRIHKVSSALSVAQAKQAQGKGGILIQLMQAGALTSLALGRFETAAVPVLLAPEIFARMMISPRTSNMIVNGLKFPRMTASSLARFFGAYDRVVDEIKKERE
jgi:hypothetical protein